MSLHTLKIPSSLTLSLGSSVTDEDFPDPLSHSVEMELEEKRQYPLDESSSSSSSTEETALESYETLGFIPVTSDVLDLMGEYKHLVKKLDHYPRGGERSDLLLTIFAAMGELLAYGFNDATSLSDFEDRKAAVDKYLKTPSSCVSSCTLV